MYAAFVCEVRDVITKCLVEGFIMRERDSPFLIPLVQVMLKKRLELRKKGRIEEAYLLVVKINQIIQDIQKIKDYLVRQITK